MPKCLSHSRNNERLAVIIFVWQLKISEYINDLRFPKPSTIKGFQLTASDYLFICIAEKDKYNMMDGTLNAVLSATFLSYAS